MSAVCVCEHRGELDEEKPRFAQCKEGGAGKHSGEREAYTNLAGGWKTGPPVRRGEVQGNRMKGKGGRVPGLVVGDGR